MVQTAVVSVEVGVEPASVILVAHLAAEHVLIFEVEDEVVIHLRRSKSGAGLGGVPLIAHTQHKSMATTGIDAQAGLGTTLAETGGTALAIGVLGKEAVAHVALAAHRDSA